MERPDTIRLDPQHLAWLLDQCLGSLAQSGVHPYAYLELPAAFDTHGAGTENIETVRRLLEIAFNEEAVEGQPFAHAVPELVDVLERHCYSVGRLESERGLVWPYEERRRCFRIHDELGRLGLRMRNLAHTSISKDEAILKAVPAMSLIAQHVKVSRPTSEPRKTREVSCEQQVMWQEEPELAEAWDVVYGALLHIGRSSRKRGLIFVTTREPWHDDGSELRVVGAKRSYLLRAHVNPYGEAQCMDWNRSPLIPSAAFAGISPTKVRLDRLAEAVLFDERITHEIENARQLLVNLRRRSTSWLRMISPLSGAEEELLDELYCWLEHVDRLFPPAQPTAMIAA